MTQKKQENLRDFIQHFNTERLKIGDCSDNVAVAAFTNDLKDIDLMKTLHLNPLKDFNDIIDMAKDHMAVDEALQSPSSKKVKKEKGEQNKAKRPKSSPASKRYTQLNKPMTRVLNHIKEKRYLLSLHYPL